MMTTQANRQRTWLRCLLFGLSLALFIISLAVTTTLLFTPLYQAEIGWSGLSAACGLTPAQLMDNYRTLIDYNTLWGSRELTFPDFVMSRSGAAHFAEVRRVFLAFQVGIPVFGLLTVVGLWLARQEIRGVRPCNAGGTTTQGNGGVEAKGALLSLNAATDPYRFLLTGGVIAIALPAGLGGLCALAWDRVFVTFHQLFFDNDYWIFDEHTDPVIRALPDQFFLHESILIFALVVLDGVVSVLAYRMLRRW